MQACKLFSALLFVMLLLPPSASANVSARFKYKCMHKNGMSDIASTRACPFARHPIASFNTVLYCRLFLQIQD
jgi:hypothetical protein